MRSSRTRSSEAYEHYLRGRRLWNRRDADSLRGAIEHFESAIRHDPQYARAYCSLAEVLILCPSYGIARLSDAFPRARTAACEAITRDDALAEAHSVLAVIKGQFEYDWPAAEREFERAFALNASHATAYQWYSEFLCYHGRFDEGAAVIARAEELDPLSPIIATLGGSPALWRRDYAGAAARYRRVLERHPEYPLATHLLGRALQGLRSYNEAIAAYLRAMPALGANTVAPPLIHTYTLAGDAGSAEALLADLQNRHQQGLASPDALAVAYAARGRADAALELFERAWEGRDGWLTMLGVDPDVDSLRQDERFIDLLRRIGIGQMR